MMKSTVFISWRNFMNTTSFRFPPAVGIKADADGQRNLHAFLR
jgi:hypothetical protein